MHNIAAFYLFLQITLQIFFFSEYLGRHLFKIASMQNGAILVYIYEKNVTGFWFQSSFDSFQNTANFSPFRGRDPEVTQFARGFQSKDYFDYSCEVEISG